jgi:hypothetical protein
METEKTTTNEGSWTWADQISSYRFWGLFLFFVLLLIPNAIINYYFSIFREEFNLTATNLGTFMAVKSFAAFGGIWLVWFMVRLKNHYLLFLFSAFTIIGLLLILIVPSVFTFYITFFLLGLSVGAIGLAIPTIISGGRGGSEMFIVSFGIITFFELTIYLSSSMIVTLFEGYKLFILVGLASAIIGSVLLIPIKATIFNSDPPKREFALTPKFREPVVVALLCLIPLYNIYFMLHLIYRFHGEINTIYPSQKILSPCAAVWSFLLIPLIPPIIIASLNTSLTSKLLINNTPNFYKTRLVILWSFIFIPISYALIQSNMNQLLLSQSSDIK